ncbi:TIGR04282 family arsenosugar biosynthesis glycosyltransferase [Pontibacter vulgaris]|uniref:TIGR04282 family arsenosugar biosynthesis glycosyltransferase n=1 Tax=Pontibacter vulgaris TaxID=2905679 RepID=UPI001FA7B74D|nr:TIGR04282 family arsenosugar biosynthesis glycosyltransferase [Pontibacter vulgaris]
MTDKRLLLLFVRNPELGKVKTRLAATVGPETALEIYLHLLQHTRSVTEKLSVDKAVYYSDKVELQDMWPDKVYQKKLQPAGDLGEKMAAAFEKAFTEGYTSVVIIGSDCQQLTQEIIERAFEELKSHAVVIGPALDGGYYLLGMNRLYPELFRNKHWSTKQVFPETIEDLQRLHVNYTLLPHLSDVDYLEDLENPEEWLNQDNH